MLEHEFQEKRKYLRFTITIPLNHCRLDSGRIGKAQTKDISAQGIGIVTDEELAPKTLLDIWITMPDNGEQIHAKGEVVWVRKAGANNYHIGTNLKDSRLKPIPIVLRTVKTRL